MRENIGLFRGKRIDIGEWVEGFYHRVTNNWTHENVHYITHFQDMPITGETILTVQYEVDPDTIGECTGLKDLSRITLFEHDVVTAKFKGNGARFNFKIIFKEGAFLFDNGTIAVPFNQIRSAVKIGNAIDNPELLKGGEGNG